MPKTGWPIVQKDDWCGEFAQKNEKPSQEVIGMMKNSMDKQIR